MTHTYFDLTFPSFSSIKITRLFDGQLVKNLSARKKKKKKNERGLEKDITIDFLGDQKYISSVALKL
jgi:hypothetical protein